MLKDVLHRFEVCSLPHTAVSQMSEVEGSGIPQGLKNLPPTPTPSRTVMKTILTMMSKSVLLETLTNLDL